MTTKTATYLTMKDLKGAAKKKRQQHQLQNRLLIGLSAAKFPQVGDVAFEQLMAVGRMVTMKRLNLFDPGGNDSSKETVDFDSDTQISPSDKEARTLAKAGYFYDEDEDVVVEVNLDFDSTAGDDAKSGGKEKYRAEEGEQIMITMRASLIEAGIADDAHIYVHCTRHNDQTALRNGVETVYGLGHLNKRNVTQLIHAFLDVENIFHEMNARANLNSVGNSGGWTGKSAANFVSLAREKEIEIDCAFLADFDREFFQVHMEWNCIIDKHIKRSGFFLHHHLVHYYIKGTELDTLQQDSADKQIFLEKAKAFDEVFHTSIHKHNRQFIAPDLLIVSCFGEEETSTIVAKLFQGGSDDNIVGAAEEWMFHSSMHKNKINLKGFAHWITQSKKPYKEDTTQGPGLTGNFMNHALQLKQFGSNMQDLVAVMSVLKQGSYVRYKRDIDQFNAAYNTPYNQCARELESGCITRNIETASFGKQLSWTAMKRSVIAQERQEA
eukprot:jgi/Psemu1/42978/gm1.42978_g